MLKSAVSASQQNYTLVRHVSLSPLTEITYGLNNRKWSSSTGVRVVSSYSSDTSSKTVFPPSSSSYPRGAMRSWELHSYGDPSDLQLTTSAKIPTIKSPSDVLIQVKAASLNPIDLAMTSGYGAETINVLRSFCASVGQPISNFQLSSSKRLIEFPLTLGRDFSGTIVEMGHGAKGKNGLKIGDDVYGVVGVQRQGSHADYVLSSIDTIRRKPKNLNFVESASIPYVGMTTWSAIRVTGSYRKLEQRKFLVLGGSGGVGTFAVQYLKSRGAQVVTTCSLNAEPIMTSLGCDFVVDYRDPNYSTLIKDYGPYDCILDLSGPANSEKTLSLCSNLKTGVDHGQFITLSPPFLSNIDKYGLLGGAVKNISDLVATNMKSWNNGGSLYKWAFFVPNGCSLETFTQLIESQKIRPVIHHTLKFDELPLAFKLLQTGHLRGKIVIDFT